MTRLPAKFDPQRNFLDIPQADRADYAHAVIKGLISGVPAVVGAIGGPGTAVAGGLLGNCAAEIFGTIVTPSLARRTNEWIREIAFRVVELEIKVESYKIEDLVENEVFVTTLLQATQNAYRTHQKVKIEAYRNIVLNAAMPQSPDEDLQLIFINFLDSMTPWHIALLHYFENPVDWWACKGITRDINEVGSTVFEEIALAFPNLAEKEDFFEMIVQNLKDRNLVRNIAIRLSNVGALGRQTTELGHQFVNFITSPIELSPLPTAL
ncbi:MAG TPA: hypothetical protein PLY91_07675 [Methanoregulaceae archaeon]|nr:hypothetical protein [Methanoregulaceae archaeon]